MDQGHPERERPGLASGGAVPPRAATGQRQGLRDIASLLVLLGPTAAAAGRCVIVLLGPTTAAAGRCVVILGASAVAAGRCVVIADVAIAGVAVGIAAAGLLTLTLLC